MKQHRLLKGFLPFVVVLFVATAVCTFMLSKSSRKLAVVNQLGDSYPGWKTIRVYVGSTTYGPDQDYYGQEGQDRTVCEIFKLIYGDCKDRFFLDLAAHDAAEISNTKALEDHHNWTGICIEANFEYTWGLAHRKCDVYQAVVSTHTGETVEFIAHPNGEPGGIGGIVSEMTDNKPTVKGERVVREATSLLDVLRMSQAPKVVDYFSFDVEGAEEMILQRPVLEEFTFLIMTVERPSKQLQKLLESFGYEFLKKHGNFGDKMYVHSSLDHIHLVKSEFGEA